MSSSIHTRSVLTFDICSSTIILEDLLRTNNVDKWKKLQEELKEFLRKEAISYPFALYQFTGDGWILLFESLLGGKPLMEFVRKLSQTSKKLYSQLIKPELETDPPTTGITIGIDSGDLVKVRLNGRDEFIGRAINVACRLQTATKDQEPNYGYKLLMSKKVYNSLKKDLKPDDFTEVRRILRNIAGDKEIHCMKSASKK